VTDPGITPVTIPVLFTVAIAVSLLLHTPPADVSLRLVVAPGHTVNVPVIGPIVAVLTVTTWVAYTVPQVVVIA
jgi:hypothetical protein